MPSFEANELPGPVSGVHENYVVDHLHWAFCSRNVYYQESSADWVDYRRNPLQNPSSALVWTSVRYRAATNAWITGYVWYQHPTCKHAIPKYATPERTHVDQARIDHDATKGHLNVVFSTQRINTEMIRREYRPSFPSNDMRHWKDKLHFLEEWVWCFYVLLQLYVASIIIDVTSFVSWHLCTAFTMRARWILE